MKALFALMVMLTVISACTINPVQQPSDEYKKGTQGIEVGFLGEGNVKKIYEGSPLDIILELKNLGSYEEPYGKVMLYGYDGSIIQFSDEEEEGTVVENNYAKKELPKLSARNAYMPQGGYDTMTFKVPENMINIVSGASYDPEFIASVCYHYKTQATPTVCIIPDESILTKNNACKPSTLRLDSQGGPVAVTKVEEEAASGNVNFVITIENLGGGKVVSNDLESYSLCPFNLKENNLNKISVEMEIKGLQKVGCTPSDGFVKLYNNKGTMHCTFRPNDHQSQTASYTTPLNIILDYHYTDSISKKIEIMNIPGKP